MIYEQYTLHILDYLLEKFAIGQSALEMNEAHTILSNYMLKFYESIQKSKTLSFDICQNLQHEEPSIVAENYKVFWYFVEIQQGRPPCATCFDILLTRNIVTSH